MSRPLGEEPDCPTDEEVAAIKAELEAMERGETPWWEKAREDAENSVEDSGRGEETGLPQTDARVYAYIPRGSRPSSWSRKTRWGNGTRRLPSPPRDESQHVRMQWGFILARLMSEGWEFCREHEKQDPAWYVDFAKALAREAVQRHVTGDCPRNCTEAEWKWLLDKTDETPVLDATPYPAPYPRRER